MADDKQPIPCVRVDGGIAVGLPATLPTGLATGIGGGVVTGIGAFSWGARAAYLRSNYFTMDDEVADSELRLRGLLGLRHAIGRGIVGLRLAAGGTAIRETTTPQMTGPETVSWQLVPAADLEITVALGLFGPWGIVLSGGPSFHLHDGDIGSGFVSSVGVTWHP